MDIDQMFETWRKQNTAPPYDVNTDALRQTLQTEEARVQRELRIRRRILWAVWIFGTGMAIFAGFWIAISIANRWSAIYVVTSAVSFGLFALGVGAMWVSRGRKVEVEPDFGNTLQEEVKRNLALVDQQLALTRHWIIFMIGMVSMMLGTLLFAWTMNRSQNIHTSSSGFWRILLILYFAWAFFKMPGAMRKVKPMLETRQQRLRELLAVLNAGE